MATPASAHPEKQQSSGQSWQPLSARNGGIPIDQTWQEGVPLWIKQAVQQWLTRRLLNKKVRDRLYARLHYHEPGIGDAQGLIDPVEMLGEESLLDWVDGTLHIGLDESPKTLHARYAYELENVLREGHSIWKVSDDYGSLERRQDKTVTSAAHDATQTARSAGRPASAAHLEEAWSATYGLHPDPSKAFGEAILAVEAVAVPAIVPRHADATLGHVLGQLTKQGHLYELAVLDKTGNPSSVEPATSIIRLLWEGHTDRHEGNRSAFPITQEAAEVAVHAAATLVQWFSSGTIRRRTT